MKVRYSMRKIPAKNYFYLLVLSVVTVVITLAIFNVYNNYGTKKESFMSQKLTSINNLDLKSLLVENSLLFVYIDDKYDDIDNDVEEKLYNELKKLDINKNFVFYNNSDKKNQNYLLKKYNINIKNKKFLLVFEDGSLVEKHVLKDNIKDEVLKVVNEYEDIDD